MNPTTQKIIKALDLQPLEMEGGYFRRTHTVSSPSKSETSVIYYLLTPDTHSKIHRLPTPEIYHFYLGDPVELLLLENDGHARTILLGNDVLNNFKPQFVVPENTWQGSRLQGDGQFALLGTTMNPAFEDSDFETPNSLEKLLETYPKEFHSLIKKIY